MSDSCLVVFVVMAVLLALPWAFWWFLRYISWAIEKMEGKR